MYESGFLLMGVLAADLFLLRVIRDCEVAFNGTGFVDAQPSLDIF